jgi:hypothetical protein
MSYLSNSRPRAVAARLAIVGALGVGSLAVASPALASSKASVKAVASVKAHVHRADIALSGLGSASVSDQANSPLSVLTAQLGSAAKLSAQLAVHANTPDLKTVAASALNLVSAEEAKAQSALSSLASVVTGAPQVAVLKADLAVTQGRELALKGLSHVSVKGKTRGITDTIGNLSTSAKGLLYKVVGVVGPIIGCPVSTGLSPLVSSAAASEQAHFETAIPLPVVGSVVNAGGSLLGTVTTDEIAQILAHALNCHPTRDGTSGGVTTASGGATASGQANVKTDGLIGSIVGAVTGIAGPVTGIAGPVSGIAEGVVGSVYDTGVLSVLGKLSL